MRVTPFFHSLVLVSVFFYSTAYAVQSTTNQQQFSTFESQGVCKYIYKPFDGKIPGVGTQNFSFKYKLTGVFVENGTADKGFVLGNSCFGSSVPNGFLPYIQLKMNNSMPPPSAPINQADINCPVPSLPQAEYTALSEKLKNSNPTHTEAKSLVDKMKELEKRTATVLIIDCQKYLEAAQVLKEGELQGRISTLRTEILALETRDRDECTTTSWFRTVRSSEPKCQNLPQQIAQKRTEYNSLVTSRPQKRICLPDGVQVNNDFLRNTAVCSEVKRVCASFNSAANQLRCGVTNTCESTGGRMTTVGSSQRCQCPQNLDYESTTDGGYCKPKVQLDCKDGAAVGTNQFGERVCVCPVTGDEMRHIQPVYVNEKCELPSANTCKAMDSQQRYIYQNNQCAACRQGLSLNGTVCGCYKGYYMAEGGCTPCPAGQTTNGEGPNTIASCKASGVVQPQPQPDASCPSRIRKPNGQCCQSVSTNFGAGELRTCADQDATQPPPASTDPKPGDPCVTRDTREPGVTQADMKCSPVKQCINGCAAPKQCVNGQCVVPEKTCGQGQTLQNGQCVPQQQQCQQGQVLQNGQCVPQQQQCKQDEEMIQGRCFPKKPNAQQPKEQPKQQQQGQTPQQQQQQQQLQAMQECQMRQPQGAWQWNGFQCLPNPNYNPQGYGTQPSVGGGVVCNFFGSDAIEVPAGEQFSVTYDVSGAKREIKVDTSPKSTTKYDRQAPTSQANTNTVLNQFGYPQNGTGAAVQTSQQGQATITAPKKKGKLKVSLIVDAVRQNSEACKPIQVTIVDAVQQQSSYDSGNTSNYDSGSQYASNTQPQDTGPTIETPSEIIAQNRRVVSSQPAQQAPEDDDAYAYLCKTLGIGCAKDAPQVDTGPSIRDLQVGNGTQQQGTTREITIDPNAEDPADLPNIGELPGEGGENSQNGQQLATDVGIDGDNKKAYSTVLNYLGENGQYAPPIGPNADTSGVLNSSDAEPTAQTEDRIGIFTRMWRWFLNLLGFGPEYVAA